MVWNIYDNEIEEKLMFILDMIASFAIAILSGMGIGSGGLLVIYLTLVSSTPQLTAQGINLLFFLFSTGAAMTVHLRRRKIYFNAVLLMAAVGIFGALLGSFTAGVLPTSLIKKLFGAMLIISGTVALFKKDKNEKVTDKI